MDTEERIAALEGRVAALEAEIERLVASVKFEVSKVRSWEWEKDLTGNLAVRRNPATLRVYNGPHDGLG